MLTQNHYSVEYLDALPYYDTIKDSELKDQVDQLIKNEMKQFKPKNYLEHLPYPELFKSSEFLRLEFERISKGEKLKVIKLPELKKTTSSDPKELEKYLNTLKQMTEYENTKMINLQLMEKYAPASWRLYNSHLEKQKNNLDKELEITKQKIDTVNKKRKFEQLECGTKLTEMSIQWDQLVKKNIELRKEIRNLEQQIKRIKKQ